MTKQNKHQKKQATLEQMKGSGRQIVLMKEDATKQLIVMILVLNYRKKDFSYADIEHINDSLAEL